MKRRAVWTAILIVLAWAVAAMGQSEPKAKTPGAETPALSVPAAEVVNGVYYLEVTGSPREMGQMHGKAMAAEVQAAVARCKADIARAFGVQHAPRIMKWVADRSAFLRRLQKHLPDLWQEMQGLADGAGVPVEDIALLNMYTETHRAAPRALGLKTAQPFGHGCTAMALRAGGKIFVAENLDFARSEPGPPLVIRLKYPDRQILLYTLAGRVGGIGVNSRGISTAITTLPQGSIQETDGLNSGFISRAILDSETVDDAIGRVKTLGRLAGAAYIIGGFDKVVAMETSPEQVHVRQLDADTPLLVQTNHMQHLTPRREIPGHFEKDQPVQGSQIRSAERFQIVTERLRQLGNAVDVAALRRLLATPPVNMNSDLLTTRQSMIVRYEGPSITLLVSASNAPGRKWNEYAFEPADVGTFTPSPGTDKPKRY